MIRGPALLRRLVVGVGCVGWSTLVVAQDPRAIERDVARLERDAQTLFAEPVSPDPSRAPGWVRQRVGDADVYMRLHDYLRATIVLTDVVEHHASDPGVADARLMLADALFQAGDLFGARLRYRDILDRADDPAHRRHADQALGRLVEIALRTRSFDGVERYFERFGSDPGAESAAAATYFRAKYLFGRAVPEGVLETGEVGRASLDAAALAEAQRLFGQVALGTTYAPQSRYFVGVIAILRGDPAAALPAFREATGMSATSTEQRKVIDLSWLAIGRVFHAVRQYEQAIEAYQHVPRTSLSFPRAVFESAWVFIAADDPASALRALEVLVAAAPNSPLVPEAQLVRANLLLRRQRFDEADAVFDEIRETAMPIEVELDAIARRHPDLAAHFAEVVREQREVFSVDVLLPASARAWSEPDAQFERGAAALSDLSLTRRLVRETTELCERLELAIASTSVANVFGDLREQSQQIEALRTRIVLARASIAESRSSRTDAGELGSIRARRRDLAARLASAPTTSDEMDERDGRRVAEFRSLARLLRETEVEVAGLEARITAMEHVLTTSPMADPAGQAAVSAEIANHRGSIGTYRGQIDEIRRAIELARIDVGVGDEDYRADAALRSELDRVVAEERRLSGGEQDAAAFARLASIESRLAAREAEIAASVAERTESIRVVVAEEKRNLERYRATLAELEGEAEVVVGGISHETFVRTRERFHDIVLRSEVGHVDVAWMRRERHREQLESYTQSRGIELEEIDSEFDDILDRSRGRAGSPR